MHIFGLINSGVFTEDYYVLFLGFTESLEQKKLLTGIILQM